MKLPLGSRVTIEGLQSNETYNFAIAGELAIKQVQRGLWHVYVHAEQHTTLSCQQGNNQHAAQRANAEAMPCMQMQASSPPAATQPIGL
jgi:hypothetical protein